jgi:hypothetical protein
MAVRLVTLSVVVASLALLLAGAANAGQAECCAARLQVCFNGVITDRSECINDCYREREEAEEACERRPSPLCDLIGPIFGRCIQRCTLAWLRGSVVCLLRHQACLGPDVRCENSPTPTRTPTRTKTPAPGDIDPGPRSDVSIPTPTPTPPTAPG